MGDYNPNHIPPKSYFLVGQKCVVINGEGKILLLKRSSKSGGGGWNLIGGGLEKGEDPVKGLKREAQEEAQIEIYDVSPIHIASFAEGKETKDPVVIICYQAKTDSDQVTLNWEHDEYKWVTKHEALNEDLSKTIRDFIQHAKI